MRESTAAVMLLGNTDSSLPVSVFSLRDGILTWCDPAHPEVWVWCCPECGWWQVPGAETCRRCGWRLPGQPDKNHQRNDGRRHPDVVALLRFQPNLH
jgi:hypothetical protein